MSELRCPMCSEPNDPDREICESCGARLKPLVLDSTQQEAEGETSPQEYSAGEGTRESGEKDPDWLARVREQVKKERSQEKGSAPTPEGPEDWLDRLRGPGDVEGEEEEVVSSEELGVGEEEEIARRIGEPDEPQAPADWLDRLRDSREETAGEPEEGLEIEEEPADSRPAPDAIPSPPSLEEERESARGSAEEPELASVVPAAGEEAPAGDIEEPPAEEHGIPAQTEVPAPPWAIPEQPEAAVEEPTPVESTLGEREVPAPPEEVLREMAEAPLGPPKEAGVDPADDLPHVPPLIMDDAAAHLAAESDAARDASVPDWLSELKASAGEDEEVVGDERAEIEPAALPTWLEAMRPVDAIRADVETRLRDKEVVESIGPLAGLRGVLSAEPVMAMPRAADAAGTRLVVTERQFAQAEILHRIVEEEQRVASETAPPKKRIPITRLAIGVVLFLAVAVSVAVDLIGFTAPSRVSRSLMPLASLIDGLSTERPGLMVVDYQPGYVGEIEAVAGQVVEQLMRKGLRLVTVSTRTSGPPLADRIVGGLGRELELRNGEHYLHLGYLPGEATAIQLLAANPRQAVAGGFLVPEELQGGSVWETPWLQEVQYLSDFGVVVVVTADPETARAWIEQAQPWMGATPLVMVVSAGVSPLVWPYYEASEPRVQGILAGLPSAVVYEQQVNGRLGVATDRWDAFGVAVWTSFVVLAIGGAWGLAQRVMRPGYREDAGV